MPIGKRTFAATFFLYMKTYLVSLLALISFESVYEIEQVEVYHADIGNHPIDFGSGLLV